MKAELLFKNDDGYRTLFYNAHDLIHFATQEGQLIQVNKSWMNLLGYSQEEIGGQFIFHFVDEQERENFIRYRNEVISGKNPAENIITALRTKSGSVIRVEGFILVETANNEVLYTTGIFRDVTRNLENEAQLKRSNEELRLREADLQQLLVYAPDAIIVIDRNGIIQFWNPKAEAIFGWTAEEVLGLPLSRTIIPPQYREAHEKGMRRYLSTGEAHVLHQTIEITALNKKGAEFFVSLTISTTHQKGEIAFIAFIRDITSQKNYEFELEKNRKALEVSNKELEQFAHVASHDIKEPIRKIKTFIERIFSEFDHLLPREAKNYLEKIQTSAFRLGDIVDGVLNYSILTNSKAPFEWINLHQIVEQIKEDLELLVNQKHAEIIARQIPEFRGARILIYQLFYNLIYNSLKFSREGVKPVVEITARPADPAELPKGPDSSDYVEITVKDNGIGFSQEFSEKIFHTFTRLNSKDKYEGTGLGLALCKHIVERHQGMIRARAEENMGAEFIVTLPLQGPSEVITATV